jgi:hypothetical protein
VSPFAAVAGWWLTPIRRSDLAEPSVASIKQAIAAKTAIPVDEQRLLFAGKDLIDAVPFEAYGLQAENTLDLLIRSASDLSPVSTDAGCSLRGGEKKKRCQYMLNATEKCSSPALTMIGLCDACQKRFCARHRLPEEHECEALETQRKKAYDENKERLESESKAAASNLHSALSLLLSLSPDDASTRRRLLTNQSINPTSPSTPFVCLLSNDCHTTHLIPAATLHSRNILI